MKALLVTLVLCVPMFAGNKTNCKKPTPPQSSGPSYSSASSANAAASATASSNQSQSQQQSQIANGGNASSSATGGNSTVGQSNEQVIDNNQIRQAPPAFAPEAFSTSPCRIAGSIGASAPFGGISLGGSKKDKECDKRALAGAFAGIGRYDLALKVLCSTEAAKSIKDCEAPVALPAYIPAVAIPAPAPVPVSAPPIEIKAVPSATVVAPVVPEIETPTTIAACSSNSNICKARLDDSILFLKQHSGTVSIHCGMTGYKVALSMRQYLISNGITSDRVVVALGDFDSTRISVVYLP